MNRRLYVLPLLLLAELAIFAPLSGIRFGSPADFLTSAAEYGEMLLVKSAPVLILAAGMTAVLMTAGIDLSVGSMTALTACVMSQFEPDAGFWMFAVPAGLAVAVALGAANGLLISRLDIPPIIATLGTLFFYRGLCHAVMRGQEHAPFVDVPGYGWIGTFAGSASIAGFLLIAGGIVFQRSRWRREILLLGGNRVAARYAGIPVDRRLVQVYLLSGSLAFPAALCHTAFHNSVKASSLVGLELEVIVATVLGGTLVTGGYGSLVGSVFGALLVAVLNEGLRGVTFWYDRNDIGFEASHLQLICLGGLLVLGVWLNSRAQPAGRSDA